MLTQLKGFIEFIILRDLIFCLEVSLLNCVFPGKKKPGYCNLNVITSTECPIFINVSHSSWLVSDIPPRYGKYGPIKTDHILFIASGAFQLAKPSDLLPELQGRLPIRVELNALTEDDFKRILKNQIIV